MNKYAISDQNVISLAIPSIQPLNAESTGSMTALLVADGQCPKIRELLAEALVPVLWLKAGQHPLETVTAALEMRRQQGQPVESLHWVSHGRPGVLQVGAYEITRQALVLHRADLEGWGIKNLALWSCRYGAESESISLLEEFTGASVFASTSILGRISEAITQWKLGDTDITIPIDSAHLSRWEHQLGEKIYTTHGSGTRLGYLDTADNSFTDLGIFNDGTSNLTTVWGLAFGKDGNLYATQEANSANHDPGDPGTKIYKVDLTSSTDPATTVLTQAPVEVTTDSSVAGDPGGPIQFHAMDVGSDGFMYALDLRGYIYKIDVSTGAATYVAETSKSDSSKITSAMDIAFDVDGKLFAVDGRGNLFEISLDGTTTAAATQLGSTSNSMLMGLIVTPDNTLYGTNFSSGKLFSINKSTGTLTEETSTSFASKPHGGDAYIAYTGWLTTSGTPVISNAGDTLTFTEGDGATVIDSSLSISDTDDTNIESATVTISSGFQSAEDVLSFSDTSAITGSWNASTGVLTLSGSDTLANYEAALESVTYNNTSDNPNTANRTISWVVNDGADNSSAASSTITIDAEKDTWSFSNDYLEEELNPSGNLEVDLNNDGILGDGTPGNSAAPTNLSSANYAAGDDYLVEGTLASTAALDAVKTFFTTFNTAQGITFDATSAYKYTNLSGTAGNLKTLSSTDLGNVTGTLTVSDGLTTSAEPALTDLQAIKANFGGSTFTYYGIQGTTKELADARNDSGFDWIANITGISPGPGAPATKSFRLTDLGLNSTHLSALIGTGSNALDATYVINQSGLTSNSNAYIGAIGGTSLAYRTDASADVTTSYLVPVSSSSSPYTNHIIGLANTASPNPTTFADFNVTGDDAASGLSLTTHFYGGEQLSHISLSGADLSTTNGYSYQQTAGSGTSSVADDIWTLSLNLTPGQPAISGSVADNSGSSILGLILHTIGSSDVGSTNDLGASVFRTQAWWNDISANDPTYKFSDICPGINIDGSNGNAIDFDFYLSKDYLERTFSTDFDAIEGGFAASGLSSISSANESTGTYIDVSKSGAISSLKLPVTISDVSSTTAGGSTDLYQVAFTNDSWSKGNLSLVYGPSVASTITGDTSGSDAEDSTITGDLDATDPQGLTDSTYFSIESGNTPANGSASIDPESGAWSYTPTANFNGSDAFTVTITDDLGGTTTQAVDLTITAVDDPATITGDTSGTGAEDASAITGNLAATDPEGLTDGSVFSIADGNGPSNGTASINAETGAWSYTPNANFNGSDAFTVTITDDLGGTTTQAVDLTITAVDDQATITGDTSGRGRENGNPITGTLTATDVDGLTDGSYFSIETTNTPANGSASIDPESGAWSYTPSRNSRGSDQFTVTITDDLGGTTTQAIDLTVTPAPTPEPTPAPTPEPTPEPVPEPDDANEGFVVITPTPSATDDPSPGDDTTSDNESPDSGSQPPVESQTITNTSSSQTGTAALVENSGNNDNRVTATLPPAVSIQSEGSSTAQSAQQAQQSLADSILERDTSSDDQQQLIEQVETFVNALPDNTQLDVRTIILTTTTTTAPGQPIVITGTTAQPNDGDSGSDSDTNTGNISSTSQTEAFVIDLTQMPVAAPTQLELNNIDFAVIVGPALITGGTGSNVVYADDHPQSIVLGADDDTLDGGGGNDTIGSAGGDDLLIGGSGKDQISGGADNDTLQGGSQADSLTGGSGDDSLFGGQGHDTLQGSSGDDILNGDAKHDLLKGGGGNDDLFGGTGRDTLQGFSGDDILKGDAKRDLLKGGSGNDDLFGGKGQDTLIGGEGADIFELSKHKDTIRDFSITDGDVIEAPTNLNLRLIQRGDHLLIKDLDNNIKTTLLNINKDDLLAHQPDLI